MAEVEGALVQPGPYRSTRPTSAPALGGPLSGQRGRQSGHRAPIGSQADGGGARAGPPGGPPRLFQEDLDALSSARDGPSSTLMNNQTSADSPFSS